MDTRHTHTHNHRSFTASLMVSNVSSQAALQAERDDSNSWLWGYEYGPNSRCMREIGPLAKLPGDGYKYTKVRKVDIFCALVPVPVCTARSKLLKHVFCLPYVQFAGQSNLDCYKFTCQDGLNLHLVVGEHEVLCPSGQDVDLRPLGYVSGILGPCPDNKELCSQLRCAVLRGAPKQHQLPASSDLNACSK